MLQEDIWEKSLNDEVDNQNSAILIQRNFPHELNDINLRNYFNIHKLDDICIETIHDYFKDNMFKDFEGFYLPHLLCRVAFTEYEKVYKAMEEVFKVMSPNIGTNNDYNMNYFQYYMTIWRRENLVLLKSYFKDIYELGLKYNLDIKYRDYDGFTSLAYYFASAPLKEIFTNYKSFITPEASSEYSILEKRVADTSANINWQLEKLKKEKIFKLINPYLSYEEIIIKNNNSNRITDEYKQFKKINN